MQVAQPPREGRLDRIEVPVVPACERLGCAGKSRVWIITAIIRLGSGYVAHAEGHIGPALLGAQCLKRDFAIGSGDIRWWGFIEVPAELSADRVTSLGSAVVTKYGHGRYTRLEATTNTLGAGLNDFNVHVC